MGRILELLMWLSPTLDGIWMIVRTAAQWTIGG